MSNSHTSQTLVVWNGEWPYVKCGVSEVRAVTTRAIASVNALIDVPACLARARKYTAAADNFVTTQSAKAGSQLESHQWVVPAIGIALTSSFVVVKSAPWGGAKMLRNGVLTAAALTAFMYPREIANRVDAIMPFSTAAVKDDAKKANKGA
ncbi:hypothetical protein ABL78_3731 [Leptomonas seymouri]|uniref:MICOS complex subunit n=1 Tax=Leptomonas seymouri TaxID=5684 RepID=A0A0N0P635_LEPSE|nr:hypothetical protein ABL78_3731 [Leptomonas seymouri]|eukprot:KPI87169.1 hypothetical protein ABL78_3731 [Leptomonas seymouri]